MSRRASTDLAQQWADRFAEFYRSDLTVAEFCRSIDCSVTTFYQWKRKLDQRKPTESFLRVATSEPSQQPIEIRLPSGVSILVPVAAVNSISEILEQVA
jgi:transposase-like protein